MPMTYVCMYVCMYACIHLLFSRAEAIGYEQLQADAGWALSDDIVHCVRPLERERERERERARERARARARARARERARESQSSPPPLNRIPKRQLYSDFAK